jgi:hypothetical protein
MKKGSQIISVVITSDGKVKATARLKTMTIDLALTRTQRNIFKHYDDDDFLDKVVAEFGNECILSEDFYIELDGKIVYRK